MSGSGGSKVSLRFKVYLFSTVLSATCNQNRSQVPTVPLRYVELNASIVGKIPLAVVSSSPLACKSSATQSLDVERSIKASSLLLELKVRLYNEMSIFIDLAPPVR